jgi:hypothetical protein
MIKWFVYIVLFLILTPCLSSAKIELDHNHYYVSLEPSKELSIDTTLNKKTKQKQADPDDKKKVKEVAKAKRLPKPEKIDDGADANSANKAKPKRQRRPPGMERPPEIPRRNGN